MNPRLRAVEAQHIEHKGHPALLVSDRLRLADRALVIPQPLGLLLALCDGTRDAMALKSAFELRAGMSIDLPIVERIIEQLDEALLLHTPRAEKARQRALAQYHAVPYRSPVCAGGTYPLDPDELRQLLDSYVAQAGHDVPARDGIRGIISPHIDYQRGGPVYAATWSLAAESLRGVEVVVIFGTDHSGPDGFQPGNRSGFGEITLTRQNYHTPFGTMPTCQPIVDAVAAAIGTEEAFANELNHRTEHSIELAMVWLQRSLGERKPEVVPILCGSFHRFTDGEAHPGNHLPTRRLIDVLRRSLAGRKALIVAAADLAHVGPEFGDEHDFGPTELAQIEAADDEILKAAATGSADAFLRPLVQERDRRRVCGLPPIYFTLKLLGQSEGEIAGYTQCPADEKGASFVTIAGMLLR